MSSKTEIMDPQEKKRVRRANLIALVVELVIIAVYLIVGLGGIINGVQSMDFAGMFESVEAAILILVVATLVAAVIFLTVKPLRTKTTIKWAIFDIIWAVLTIISLVS